MQTSEEADSGLKKKIQHECEHNGKDDGASDVERREDSQPEQATEKKCPRIGRQRHLRFVDGLVHHRSMGVWRMIVQRRALRRTRGSNHTFSLPNLHMRTCERVHAALAGPMRVE